VILGVAYKANVDDMRESPALKIKKLAEGEGMTVRLFDPHIARYHQEFPRMEEAVRGADCVVLVTDHKEFLSIDPKVLSPRHQFLVDTRNCLDHQRWRKAGFQVKVLGNGSRGP
jgi:UDP-N-acetyl-D-mannosaminuronic acid dehydrogenase